MVRRPKGKRMHEKKKKRVEKKRQTERAVCNDWKSGKEREADLRKSEGEKKKKTSFRYQNQPNRRVESLRIIEKKKAEETLGKAGGQSQDQGVMDPSKRSWSKGEGEGGRERT